MKSQISVTNAHVVPAFVEVVAITAIFKSAWFVIALLGTEINAHAEHAKFLDALRTIVVDGMRC